MNLRDLFLVGLFLLVVGLLPRLILEVAWIRARIACQPWEGNTPPASLRAQTLAWLIGLGLVFAILALTFVLASRRS